MAYDAWGKRRAMDGSNATPDTVDGVTDNRGFTGHEMLDQLDLVHMNGRVYDPQTARFLSADPILQDPLNGQSYNRYSYVLNNPTNFTDPTGFTCASEGAQKGCTGQGITTVGFVNCVAPCKMEGGKEKQNETSPGSGKKTDPNATQKVDGKTPLANYGGGRGGCCGGDFDSADKVSSSKSNPGNVARAEAPPQTEISIGYTDTPVKMGTSHALVIATDLESGEKYATRAGPSIGADKGGLATGPMGYIYAQSGVYNETFRDPPSKVRDNQIVGVLNMDLASVAKMMREFEQVTNNSKVPYSGLVFNSNSYAFTFVESLGFVRPKPNVYAPGWSYGTPSKELQYENPKK